MPVDQSWEGLSKEVTQSFLMGAFVALCASLGVGWLLYKLICHLSLRRKLSGIPSSRSYPILGHGAIVKPDPEGFVDQVMGMASIFPFPRMCLFWLGPNPALMLYSPELMEKIVTKREHLNKGFAYDLLHPWLGRSLLTTDKNEWRPRRKMLTPTFHYDILKDFLPIFNHHSRILIQKMNRITDNSPMEVLHTISLCALDAICETSMGKTVNAQQETDSEYVRAIADINEIVQNRTKNPLTWSELIFNRTKDGTRHKQCLEILHGFTRKVINERLEEMRAREWRLEGRLAFLDLLLHMWNEGSMEWKDIQPEVDTFMFEGHDTTATALTWALHLIGNDDNVQRLIHEEVDAVFVGDEISVDDLGKLKYLECCVKESLRLFPSVPIIMRELGEDQELNGHLVPKGTHLLLNIYLTHRDHNHWNDPEVFRPERFLPDNSARHAYSFVPFSAGSRNCIGQRFALMEEKTILAWIFRHFKIKSSERRFEVRTKMELIMRPQKEIHIQLEKRRSISH
ncbi:cyp-31A3 [Pristionchus pacificus]|nr:cyp-31A3 [Pristionchus pacificus]